MARWAEELVEGLLVTAQLVAVQAQAAELAFLASVRALAKSVGLASTLLPGRKLLRRREKPQIEMNFAREREYQK
jgi:hypothetical protein